MLTLMLWYSLSIYISVLADQPPEYCIPYELCHDFQGITDAGDTSDINDTEIAETGHMSGLKPESYHLTLHFEDTTRYTGSINIAAKVAQETNRFAVHMDNDTIKYNLSKTIVHHFCVQADVLVNCLEKIAYDKKKRLFLFWLKHKVPVGVRLILKFQRFTGFVYNSSLGVGSIGLNSANYNDVEAIHTNFLTKLASTVFPCFDHPSLKVNIQLCLEYPKDYKVASTAQPLWNPTIIDSDHLQQCFEYTPIIPVYSFTFALMWNYDELVYQGDTLEMGIFVPKGTGVLFSVLKEKLHDTLRSVRKITNTDLPFRRIKALLLHMDQGPTVSQVIDSNAAALENAGLISLYVQLSTNAQWQKYHGGHFYRAIVHQWIGAGFTVSHWGEICLQQGIAEYLEWILWQQHENITINSIIASIPSQFIYENHPPMSETLANYPAEHNPGCQYRAALIFHMVSEVYEVSTLKEYVATLSGTYSSRNVFIDIWDETMIKHTKVDIMKGYIKSWFSKFTPVTLQVRFYDNLLLIKQIGNYNWSEARPIPIKINSSNPKLQISVVLSTTTTLYKITEDLEWLLVDPNNALLAVKIYNSALYQDTLIEMSWSNRTHVSREWRQNYVSSFCNAVLSNKLPMAMDSSISKWKEVFMLAYSFTTTCDCCLTAAKLRPEPKCHTEMGNRCERIELVRMLGYNADSKETVSFRLDK